MYIEMKPLPRRFQSGLTLVELVMFIVIVSVALAGVLTVLNFTVKSSADPMVAKQMLAIAEALLEEVQMKSFTYCDPTDSTAATAASAVVGGVGCTAKLEVLGPEAGETRNSATTPFNNVNDYYVAGTGYLLASPIPDITSTFTAPAGYSAKIDIVPEAFGPALNQISSSACASGTDCTALQVLRIAVTVTHGGDSLTVEGYRTRYSPNF